MRKLVSLVSLLISFFFMFSFKINAQDPNFLSTIDTTYEVTLTGDTKVSSTIYLENLKTDVYAVSYALTLNGIKPEAISAQDQNGNKLNIKSQEQKDGSIKININFPDTIVGKGNNRTFTLNYLNKTVAVKTGEVWEITIPKLTSAENFNSYIVRLVTPKSLGNLAYVAPHEDETKIDTDKTTYIFKNKNSEDGITAAFGNFQVFSFELTYHLENTLPINSETTIAIPPDSSYQKMYYQDMSPKPNNVNIDEDGNWEALYTLKPNDRFDVKVKGAVQIFPSPIKGFKENSKLQDDLRPTEFWQSNDPQIIKLAHDLKTPKAIYDYVTKTLKYDLNRVKPNIERFGAVRALENPKNAICMEFTDLFIALARAAGIPAREINGYAYTENPDIEPISLVSDVLHAWPEYYDSKRQIWIPVDPTWGSTSGVDFFSKLDLRHFAFVIHGADPNTPYPAGSYKLGTNPQKDVFVSFGKLPDISTINPELEINFSSLTIKNTTPNALYNQKINIFYDENLANSGILSAIPPFGYSQTKFVPPSGFLGFLLPQTIDARVGQLSVIYNIPKTNIILRNFFLIFLSGILILSIVFSKKIIKIVKSAHAKITKQPS